MRTIRSTLRRFFFVSKKLAQWRSLPILQLFFWNALMYFIISIVSFEFIITHATKDLSTCFRITCRLRKTETKMAWRRS